MTTVIRERPILFSGPMVRALLNGSKTQTRRVIKPQPISTTGACRYGKASDRLWVKETFDWVAGTATKVQRGVCEQRRIEHTVYRADGHDPPSGKWTPSIHMPRWASRITLEITGVRLERLNAISEADAKAEGITLKAIDCRPGHSCREQFADLWDTLNAKRGYGWASNPWVWVIEFKRLDEAWQRQPTICEL